jgi:hypothetical protein
MWSANATNNYFILQNLTTCFGSYGPSSSDNYRKDIQYVLFRRFSFYCNTSIIFMTMRLIYCFLIYIYTILRKFNIIFCSTLILKLDIYSLEILSLYSCLRIISVFYSVTINLIFEVFFQNITAHWPILWSSCQSSWLQIRRPGFDSRHYQKKSSGSGTGSTQPRYYNWGSTW